MTDRNISLFIYKNPFCLIWKLIDIGFSKASEDKLKPNF